MVQSEQPKITNKEAIAELEDFKKYIIGEERKNIVQYVIDKLKNEDKALFEEFNKGHRMGSSIMEVIGQMAEFIETLK